MLSEAPTKIPCLAESSPLWTLLAIVRSSQLAEPRHHNDCPPLKPFLFRISNLHKGKYYCTNMSINASFVLPERDTLPLETEFTVESGYHMRHTSVVPIVRVQGAGEGSAMWLDMTSHRPGIPVEAGAIYFGSIMRNALTQLS